MPWEQHSQLPVLCLYVLLGFPVPSLLGPTYALLRPQVSLRAFKSAVVHVLLPLWTHRDLTVKRCSIMCTRALKKMSHR